MSDQALISILALCLFLWLFVIFKKYGFLTGLHFLSFGLYFAFCVMYQNPARL